MINVEINVYYKCQCLTKRKTTNLKKFFILKIKILYLRKIMFLKKSIKP